MKYHDVAAEETAVVYRSRELHQSLSQNATEAEIVKGQHPKVNVTAKDEARIWD